MALQNGYSLAMDVVQFKLLDDFLDSLGVAGPSFDTKSTARRLAAEMTQKLENGRQEVYPGAPDLATTGPALPLQVYEGTYHHPAYQNFTLAGTSAAADKEGGAPLALLAKPLGRSYLNTKLLFHHVSGENWWVLGRSGPGFFLTDELAKAKFEVGVDGKVAGMGLQAEPALQELAWFEKVA